MVLYRVKHDDEFAVAPPHSGWSHDVALESEAEAVAPRIAALKAALDAGALPEVAFVAGYLIAYATVRHGGWLCGRRQRPIVVEEPMCQPPRRPAGIPPVDCDVTRVTELPGWDIGEKATAKLNQHEAETGAVVTIARLFAEWQLQGIPLYAAASIAHWASGHRPFRLLNHVPSVQSVLRMQIGGERCVTAFVKPEQLSRRIEDRDPFSFVVHDLKHMENFVGGGCYAEQIGLLRALGSPELSKHVAHLDEQFQNHFAYVLADMNSRADHLFAFFKGKLLCAHVRWLAAQDKQHSATDEEQAALAQSRSLEGEHDTEPSREVSSERQVGFSALHKPSDWPNRIWLSQREEETFGELFARVLECLGLEQGSKARNDAEVLYDIDPLSHVHKKGFSLPNLVAHFRAAGMTHIASIGAQVVAERQTTEEERNARTGQGEILLNEP